MLGSPALNIFFGSVRGRALLSDLETFVDPRNFIRNPFSPGLRGTENTSDRDH
jgi:hypothetical protein